MKHYKYRTNINWTSQRLQSLIGILVFLSLGNYWDNIFLLSPIAKSLNHNVNILRNHIHWSWINHMRKFQNRHPTNVCLWPKNVAEHHLMRRLCTYVECIYPSTTEKFRTKQLTIRSCSPLEDSLYTFITSWMKLVWLVGYPLTNSTYEAVNLNILNLFW